MSENVNRWAGFSDEEITELRRGVLERHDDSKAVPAEYRERAGRLATELRKEVKRRESEKTSYRGPGRYRHHSGDVYEVLGKTFAGAEYEKVILRLSITDEPGQLLAEMMADFEDTISGLRRYTYLGPLEDPDIEKGANAKPAVRSWELANGNMLCAAPSLVDGGSAICSRPFRDHPTETYGDLVLHRLCDGRLVKL